MPSPTFACTKCAEHKGSEVLQLHRLDCLGTGKAASVVLGKGETSAAVCGHRGLHRLLHSLFCTTRILPTQLNNAAQEKAVSKPSSFFGPVGNQMIRCTADSPVILRWSGRMDIVLECNNCDSNKKYLQDTLQSIWYLANSVESTGMRGVGAFQIHRKAAYLWSKSKLNHPSQLFSLFSLLNARQVARKAKQCARHQAHLEEEIEVLRQQNGFRAIHIIYIH